MQGRHILNQFWRWLCTLWLLSLGGR